MNVIHLGKKYIDILENRYFQHPFIISNYSQYGCKEKLSVQKKKSHPHQQWTSQLQWHILIRVFCFLKQFLYWNAEKGSYYQSLTPIIFWSIVKVFKIMIMRFLDKIKKKMFSSKKFLQSNRRNTPFEMWVGLLVRK